MKGLTCKMIIIIAEPVEIHVGVAEPAYKASAIQVSVPDMQILQEAVLLKGSLRETMTGYTNVKTCSGGENCFAGSINHLWETIITAVILPAAGEIMIVTKKANAAETWYAAVIPGLVMVWNAGVVIQMNSGINHPKPAKNKTDFLAQQTANATARTAYTIFAGQQTRIMETGIAIKERPAQTRQMTAENAMALFV